MWTNYHSHTRYSDGSDEPEAYVLQAIELGLKVYGFSCHAPISFPQDWCMKSGLLPSYYSEIHRLKEKYQDQLEIMCGLEVDYIPGVSSPSDYRKEKHALEYTIGSVHYLDYFPSGEACNIDGRPEEFFEGLEKIWKNDIRAAVKRYYSLIREMVSQEPPDIIGHLDKICMHNMQQRYFREDESWYKMEVLETLAAIKRAGSIMEINTRGMYKGGLPEPYPSYWIIQEASRMKIPITLSSDTHHPAEITRLFPEMAAILKNNGIYEQTILTAGKRKTMKLP